MSAFAHLPFGPWARGMVRPERASDVPADALLDAVNVDVRPEGSVASRMAWEQVLQGNAHSLYEAPDGTVYGVVNNQVSVFDSDGLTPITSVSGKVSWTDVAGTPYFADSDAVYRLTGTSATPLEAVSDTSDHLRELVGMPAGRWLSYWNGRLVVARGGTLVFSEPLRYEAHDPLTGYLMLGQWIEWLVALETGLYVGLKGRVLWLSGAQPAELSVKQAAGRSASGMATTIPSENGRVAVFFTPKGFALGDAAGNVQYPQAAYFTDLPLYPGKLVYHNSRIFALRAL